jgi:proteic killer suppression protein
MIRNFRHKGLRQFFTMGDRRGIGAAQADRLRRILDRLDAAARPEDMNLPGFRYHGLAGPRKGTYAVSVSGNWRITFGFEDGDSINVNLEDYH